MSELRFLPRYMPGIPRRVVAGAGRVLSRALAIDRVQRLAQSLQAHRTPAEFSGAALRALQVSWSSTGSMDDLMDSGSAPRRGPLLLVSNHPYGVLDALCWMEWCGRLRSDWRFIGLSLWSQVPVLGERMLAADGGRESAGARLRTVRTALAWLREGHAIGMFPAGVVAHWLWRTGRIEEPPWEPSVGLLVRRAAPVVVPGFVPGCNGALFQILAALHPNLQNAWLVRELFNKRGRHIELQLGQGVPAERLMEEARASEMSSLEGRTLDASLTQAIRARVLALGDRFPSSVLHEHAGSPVPAATNHSDRTLPAAR